MSVQAQAAPQGAQIPINLTDLLAGLCVALVSRQTVKTEQGEVQNPLVEAQISPDGIVTIAYPLRLLLEMGKHPHQVGAQVLKAISDVHPDQGKICVHIKKANISPIAIATPTARGLKVQ